MSNHSYCSNNHIEGKSRPLLSKFRGQVTELLRTYEVPASNLDFYFADQVTLWFYQYPQAKLWEIAWHKLTTTTFFYIIFLSTVHYIIVSELKFRSRYGDKAVGWKSRNPFSSLKLSEGLCKLSNVLFNWDLYSGLKRPARESDHSIHLVPSFNKWSNTSNPPYTYMTFVMFTGLLKLSLINKNKPWGEKKYDRDCRVHISMAP
jgi:hypothetical protein